MSLPVLCQETLFSIQFQECGLRILWLPLYQAQETGKFYLLQKIVWEYKCQGWATSLTEVLTGKSYHIKINLLSSWKDLPFSWYAFQFFLCASGSLIAREKKTLHLALTLFIHTFIQTFIKGTVESGSFDKISLIFLRSALKSSHWRCS